MFHKRTFKPAILLCALLTVMLALAACGSDEATTTSGTTAPPTTAAPTTAAPTTAAPTTAAPTTVAPTTAAPTTAPPTTTVIDVGVLFDGEGPRDGVVRGSVLWDATSARLCEVLMESFPPQCGGLFVVIANPEGLDVSLDEEQGVRWTPSAVDLAGTFDGSRFVLDALSDAVDPTADDQSLVATFLAFVADPTTETLTAMPLAESVSLGLSTEVVKAAPPADLVDPEAWTLDVADYDGYAGPFSVLDVAAPPVITTIGSHNRCAGPPVAAPEGFGALRRVSIQPESATSCIEWWTVDFFVDDQGFVQAITLDLFGP